jgi:acetoin utilization deacetylase AcuC-like enzyme
MATTAIIYTEKYLAHNPGRDHPESPQRLMVIMQELKANGFFEKGFCSLVKPEKGTIEDLKLVHEEDYITLVESYCRAGGGVLDLGDTVVSKESFNVAQCAVAGSLKAVNLVSKGLFHNSFALVRPPGHHAGAYYARGFCIFNNIAIAATHLLKRHGFKRVLILDIDAHHGNGTQELFYHSANVLYVGLHQDPTGFPGTGFIDEVGEGEGVGYTVNIPFPFRINNAIYLEAFDQIILPIVEQYKPQFILVSTGFDMHYTDPVASLGLTIHGYAEIFERILNVASKLCDGKVSAILEGGYSLIVLGKIASAVIAKMSQAPLIFEDEQAPKPPEQVAKRAETIIQEVKRTQSRFWNLK